MVQVSIPSHLERVSDWTATCAQNVLTSNVTTGFIDRFGQAMPLFTNETWGIT
jgi:hypothetical protein